MVYGTLDRLVEKASMPTGSAQTCSITPSTIARFRFKAKQRGPSGTEITQPSELAGGISAWLRKPSLGRGDKVGSVQGYC